MVQDTKCGHDKDPQNVRPPVPPQRSLPSFASSIDVDLELSSPRSQDQPSQVLPPERKHISVRGRKLVVGSHELIVSQGARLPCLLVTWGCPVLRT